MSYFGHGFGLLPAALFLWNRLLATPDDSPSLTRECDRLFISFSALSLACAMIWP